MSTTPMLICCKNKHIKTLTSECRDCKVKQTEIEELKSRISNINKSNLEKSLAEYNSNAGECDVESRSSCINDVDYEDGEIDSSRDFEELKNEITDLKRIFIKEIAAIRESFQEIIANSNQNKIIR